MQDQKDLDRAAEVLSWNKRLMSMLGLWPFKPNTLIFSINFSYFSFLMILEYLDLLLFAGDLEHVIMNLTENMAFSQIFVRMSMLRLYNAQIGEVITEAMKDFDRTSYKTAEEVKTVMTYNARSKVFVKLLMTFVALTASSYYLTPIIIILGSGGLPEIPISENVTQIIYLLPYRFHLFYAVESMRAYTITYALQMPFVFVSGFGQSAADCIMVTLVFHICGQMSVLALRINNIDTEVCDCKGEVRHVVRMHIRLLRMGQIIRKAFSVTLLAHLVGATSLVCILGYQILTNFARGERGVLVTFLIFQFLVLLILYAHCTVGENLLTEVIFYGRKIKIKRMQLELIYSAKVCQAFYDCHWYNMSKNNARMIILCMARSQKPLCLTAGKFTIFCLSTLTDICSIMRIHLADDNNDEASAEEKIYHEFNHTPKIFSQVSGDRIRRYFCI
ncbi:odorant receptor 67a-like [Temnothorax americanus]|uniref:odorant receptor 67a-like n=1 Tax=Temnothorax americanus TaxID=1964332 RepID=UPI0040688DFF